MEEKEKRPNIILIEVDQMRGDCLGIKDHPTVKTPYLDMMTKYGFLFNNAYSAVPSCIAARTSILTGLSPATHGRVGYRDGEAWDYQNTLAHEFSRAGYHTQAIGKMHVHPARNLMGFHNVILHDGYMGFNRNYDTAARNHWHHSDDYLPWLKEQVHNQADIIDSGLECNSWMARPWPYAEHLHPTNWVVDQSIDFLRKKDPRKPFFLKMSFVRPHSPLDPPSVYFDRYRNKEIEDPPVGNWVDKSDLENKGLDINTSRGKIGEDNLKRARRAYYALITHIDHQIGRFLQVLKEYNEMENTIILFVADHGDMLGDHNFFRKALPYEGSAAIPLLIYDPGNILQYEQGTTIPQTVELRDIMPTLLDFADIEIPDKVEGKSLKTLLEGNENNWRKFIHGEHSYGELSNHFLVNEKEKYIWYSQTGAEQYFNLKKDPQEKIDLSQTEEYKERVNYLRKILINKLKDREEGYSDGEKLISGKTPQAVLSQ